MEPERSFLIEDGKEAHLYQTDILDEFLGGGRMEEIGSQSENGWHRKIYKITKESRAYILKTISCPLDDESKKELIEEYKINLRCSELSKGIVKPKKYREEENIRIKRFTMEILYDYCGENLLSLMGKENAKNIMSIMTSVAETMKVLEQNNISHYDLKPTNMVIQDGVVRIIDFGSSRRFDNIYKLRKTTAAKRFSSLYAPPEIIRHKKGQPVKVDVFCWGMTLYQLITNKQFEELAENSELRVESKNYPKFLEKIKNIVVDDNCLKEKIKKILLNVLSERHEDRPTFTELCEELKKPRMDSEEKTKGKIRSLEKKSDIPSSISQINEETRIVSYIITK